MAYFLKLVAIIATPRVKEKSVLSTSIFSFRLTNLIRFYESTISSVIKTECALTKTLGELQQLSYSQVGRHISHLNHILNPCNIELLFLHSSREYFCLSFIIIFFQFMSMLQSSVMVQLARTEVKNHLLAKNSN